MSPDKTPEAARELLHGLEQDPHRPHQWGLIALTFAVILFALAGYRIATIVATNSERGQANSAALREARCLVSDLIRQTGVGSVKLTAASSAEDKRSVLRREAFVRAIRDAMTPEMRAEDERLTGIIDAYGGGQIKVPKCDRPVADPRAAGSAQTTPIP